MLTASALVAITLLSASIGLDVYSPRELDAATLRRLGATAGDGVVVTHVYAASPADRAGVREGDVLLRLDGVPLRTREEMSAVRERHNPQDRVLAAVARAGSLRELEIQLDAPAEMFAKACDARDAEGCFAAGNRFRDGQATPRDLPRAARYYEQGCALEQWAACLNLGRALRDGSGLARDASKAVALFQRACDAGVAAGCHHLGRQYLLGDGVAVDEARGRELIAAACASGDPDACRASRPKPPAPPPPSSVAAGPAVSCQGSYALADGRFSFTKSVASSEACAAAAIEHARTICRIKGAAPGTPVRGQWTFHQERTNWIKGFTTTCP